VASAFGITEATYQLRGLNRDYPGELVYSYLGIAAGYALIVGAISAVGWLLERRVEMAR
jgi:glutamate transport system permease protein